MPALDFHVLLTGFSREVGNVDVYIYIYMYIRIYAGFRANCLGFRVSREEGNELCRGRDFIPVFPTKNQ